MKINIVWQNKSVSKVWHRSRVVKQFIQNFNFENPDFGDVPEGFPWVSKEGLTREEAHLSDAITTAWIIQQPSTLSRITAYIQTSKVINSTLKLSAGAFAFTAFVFIIISNIYYLNVEYGLGLTFLTEFFA